MKIIISPAKKMNTDIEWIEKPQVPRFLEETGILMEQMQKMPYEQLKLLWGCNDRIAQLNFERLSVMDLLRQPIPAILSYEGLQYQHMAPAVFSDYELTYIEEHLRILSGFYGVLCPFDGVTPYRLEMQAKLAVENSRNLYDFWGDKLYQAVMDPDHKILNLASKEYAKCIETYLRPEDCFVTVEFGERTGDKVRQKGTFAKMARGEMVRFMAEQQITDFEGIKEFRALGLRFCEELSNEAKLVFVV